MLRYGTFQKANNKGADQFVRMRSMVCAFVVHKPLKAGFIASGPKLQCSAFITLCFGFIGMDIAKSELCYKGTIL